MDLNGILSIAGGKFHMSLKNFLPKDFMIVEGGTISFAGPLTSAQLNVNAMYQKTASLTSLNSESLKDIGRTEISAILGLTGNLMNPNPTFSFDFPKLNDNDQLRVFAALDTANQQNGIRQFFSFVFLNTFITSETNFNSSQPIGAGIDLVTGILNSFLSAQMRNVNIGVNYNVDENYKEYSADVQVNLLNDKLLLKTTLGLGYNNELESNNASSFRGGAALYYPINENWGLDLFYFYDPTVVNNALQGGGISLKYRLDFNNRKDFMESWKVKKKEKKQNKEQLSNQ
jgi:hypothetical protein